MEREQLMYETSNVLKIIIRLFVLSMMFFGLAVVFHQGSPSQASAQTEEDTTAPTVSSIVVTSDTGDDEVYLDDHGVYGIGDRIEVTVAFSENVAILGNPQLELTIGSSARNAAYRSTTGSKVVFSYTVAVGDSDTDGISIAADKINLKGGAIKDLSGNSADLSHSAMSTQSGHKVDGIRPTITNVYLIGSTHTSDGVITIGEFVTIGLDYSEDVVIAIASPKLSIDLGGTAKVAEQRGWNNPGKSSYFAYTVAKGDLALGGVAISANSIIPSTVNGATMKDKAGNDAVLTHSAVAEDSNHIVDGVPATVRSVTITSNPGSDKTYGVGDTIEVTVTFSESVRVPRWTGGSGGGVYMPRLELNIGGVEKAAKTHERESITGTAVVFQYTVQDGDDDANGISVGANKLSLNGGSIRDANGSGSPGGNSADLTHSAVADDSGHKVATSGPPKSTDATLSALTLSSINIGTFASGTTSYSDQVPNSVSQTTVTPTVNHSGASYVNRLGGFADSDGAIPLAVGSNVITVEVTAEDDSTTKTYTVIVTRASNNRPATDAPTISGTAQVGQALTAETSGTSPSPTKTG